MMIPQRVARPLFVLTILVGSFLLFMIQPMVARMVLPRLGGAPNVWNSAMLVYQALLLGGYAYAHLLSRQPVERQAKIHLSLFVLAGLTLPVGLVALAPPQPGWEALWVPALFALSIGPIFLVVSAQAPLMQRWFSAHPGASEPWALYAASNFGSFAGLIAYPLVVEPLMPIAWQSWLWSAGYVILAGLVLACALARRALPAAAPDRPAVAETVAAPVGLRTILLWLALAAVPSGLMLSTTTHLTTDLFAMPLLWVIPLGLYLLSFTVAFSDRRGAANLLSLLAWPALLGTGAMAMVSSSIGTMLPALTSVGLLFLLCVALHARLYSLRPEPARLTLFYLVMSAGGALGGLFTALIAPLVFDWVWEHPLLVLLAALLLVPSPRLDWRALPGIEPAQQRIVVIVLFAFAVFCCWQAFSANAAGLDRSHSALWLLGATVAGLALSSWRLLVTTVLLASMVAQGGYQTIADSINGVRQRSYFGVYTVRDRPSENVRTIAHGTTLHGQQSTVPALRLKPLSYYGPTSGVGLTLAHAQQLYGKGARVGVVGLGAGSLACYRQPGSPWTFYEIDPVMLGYSRDGTFTFVRDCAPDARMVIGDARIELEKAPPASFDVLVIDAFSSDSVPLHLLTREALMVYERALTRGGVMLIHISNRFIDLEPALAAGARTLGLATLKREDTPSAIGQTSSSWIAMSRDPARLQALRSTTSDPWLALKPPAPRGWTDDHSSILPYVRWGNLVGHKP